MKFGFVVPFAREREFVELGRLAEQSGWDMILTWEPVFGQDAWSQLAAAAVSTEQIRLGTLLTPVPARRPWELAAQSGTVDRLSDGRLTLGVGLGAVNANWRSFLPDEGRATRAQQLDEGLAVWSGLLAGQPFSCLLYTSRAALERRSRHRARSPASGATPTSAGLVRRRPAPQKTASALARPCRPLAGSAARGRRRAGGPQRPHP